MTAAGDVEPESRKPEVTAEGSLCQGPHIALDRAGGMIVLQAQQVQHYHQYYVLPKQQDDPENCDY